MSKVLVVDDFVINPDAVRQSALTSGFGTWRPDATIIGYDNYDGVNINGMHSCLIKALTDAMGCSIYPESMIFRVTGEKSDPSRIHSDRMFGTYSCIVYLSRDMRLQVQDSISIYAAEACEMPSLDSMEMSEFDRLKLEMDQADEKDWSQVHYVEGKYNRALIFKAPLYHARIPKLCKGTTPENSRMIWVTHFNVGGIGCV